MNRQHDHQTVNRMASSIFISYAHADDDHVARVNELIDALRTAGLQVASDRDVTTPQGPPEGWPAWMLDRIEEADWVLVVCDQAYYRRFRGTETSGLGLGARWEGTIIGTALYTEGTRNRKFVPVLLDDESTDSIPEPLRGSTRYRIPAELPALIRALHGKAPKTGQPLFLRRKKSYAMFLGGLAGGLLLIFLLLRSGPPPPNFALTVYVYGPAGLQDLPLRNQGAVLLDLGGDRRRETIGDRGQAFFPEIPAGFRGKKVNVVLDASGYERADDRPLPLNERSLYLAVHRKPVRIQGNVLDPNGKPMAGATVSVADVTATSGEQGQFDLKLSDERVQDHMVLRVAADGYQPWSQEVIPNGGAVTAMLQK